VLSGQRSVDRTAFCNSALEEFLDAPAHIGAVDQLSKSLVLGDGDHHGDIAPVPLNMHGLLLGLIEELSELVPGGGGSDGGHGLAKIAIRRLRVNSVVASSLKGWQPPDLFVWEGARWTR